MAMKYMTRLATLRWSQILVFILHLVLVQSGEIVLCHGGCPASSIVIFASLESSDCVKANLLDGSRQIFGVQSSPRTIAPSCAFHVYADRKCTKLLYSINSSGSHQKCLPIRKGAGSYKVTCTTRQLKRNVNLSPIERRTVSYNRIEEAEYIQPPMKYRGFVSPHHTIYGSGFLGSGTQQVKPAPGSSSLSGLTLAQAYFKQMPQNAKQYRANIKTAGATYELFLEGSAPYTAESAIATIGQAAFASMMADTVTRIQYYNDTWFSYYLEDFEGSAELGFVNLTYVS